MQRSGLILFRIVLFIAAGLLRPSAGLAQTALLDQAEAAYEEAGRQDATLSETRPDDRTRADYLRVIQLYERVYLITPHTGYADDALIRIAGLYEAIDETDDAVRTLEFLAREYPASRHAGQARRDIERLRGGDTPAPVAAVDTGSGSGAGGRASVNGIRHWDSGGALRIVIDMDAAPVFRQGEVDNPPRAYLDIENARLGPGLDIAPMPVGSGRVETIRVAQHDADTVRVVLDLVELSTIEAATLSDPDRLVVDVLNGTRLSPPVPLSPEPVAENTGGSEEAPRLDRGTAEARIGTPAQPNGQGDHSLVRSLGLKVGRVVIDPGHGGHDTGTIGPSGLTEKELVLDIARRLKEQIESKLGAEVILTRVDDSFVPLEDRAAIANRSGADLFLSIHANSSRADSIRGFETYVLNVTTSREELETAARENASSQASISDFEGILQKIMLQDKLDESREFASHVQRALAGQTQFGRNRGVKEAPFIVLIGANMPSILAEISFISNPDDERLLKQTERRQEFADALFEGVRSYADTLSAFRTARVED